ncbi:MAG: tRNA pseudouridine(13) synthase TruD [Candidatus Omnitrophota bacterium]|nr:tRNA pseudouridine(13) synthase TruD [Candidatus Omnitrophota bacterium]
MKPLKIKVQPDDFVVEEIAELPLRQRGKFAVYFLRKKSWSTLELLRKLSQEFKIPFSFFSYGGRKDKHALTTQYITIKHQKQIKVEDKRYSLSFMGFMDRPMGPDLIMGNKFEVVVRELCEEEINSAIAEIEIVKTSGYCNYFDDQRFGSFDKEQGFIAEKIIKKQYNGALKVYLTHISSRDRQKDKQKKQFFSENWKDWKTCCEKAETEFEKNTFSFLMKNSKGFLPMLQKIPKEEMSLFFSCYQSYLWNELLRRIILKQPKSLLKFYEGMIGSYIFYTDLDSENTQYLKTLNIPTLSSKMKVADSLSRGICEEILMENGIKTSMFNIRQVRQAFFKSSERKAIVVPLNISFDFLNDEIYKNSKKLVLKFSLPRASYATMFVKRIFSSTLQ